MTDAEVVEAAARAEAATAGPWKPYYTVHGDPFVVAGRHYFPGDILATVSTAADDYGRDDALFIAHARTDVPALAAEVLRLRAIVAALVEAGE